MTMLALFLGLLAGASCMSAPMNGMPKHQMDAAFTSWKEQQQALIARERQQALMEREIKRLAHPDVKMWLVFEGLAQPAVICGSEKTDAIHREAARLHSLDVDSKRTEQKLAVL